MKNLENVVGLQEMNLQEMREVSGGVFDVISLSIGLFCVAAYLYDNKESFAAGVEKAINCYI